MDEKQPKEIRLLPLTQNDFPSMECAKLFIENGFYNNGEIRPGCLDIFMGDFHNNTFVLFQYQGTIIGSGIMYWTQKSEPYIQAVIYFDMDKTNVL